MDLNQMVRNARRHWFIGLCAFALVMGVGLAAAYLPAKQYQASTTLLVEPNPNSDPNGAFQAVTVGLPQLAAKASSTTFGKKVYRTLPTALQRSAVSITTATDPASGVLTIKAESTDPAATAPIANAFATALRAAQTDNSFVQLSTLDHASFPTAPSSPVKGPILLGAFVLGLIAALLSTLVAGALSKHRRRADEFRDQLGTSVLAEVPNAPRRIANSDRLWATLDPREAPGLVEALQRLRTNVELALQHMPEGFVVAVTSAGDAEGKSTIAANLAWLLAGVGHEVVLIDADLRHPSLSRLLRQHPGRGLSSGASGDIADLLQSTRMSTLSFIPAGVPSRHPAEVISTALPRVLQALRGPDRIVIVDAPPLGSVAETATIASITGSAVLVIDTRQRDPDEIEHAVLELQDRHASLFGIVLNRVREKRSTSPYTLAQPMITNGAAAFRPMVTSAGADGADLETQETGPGRSSD